MNDVDVVRDLRFGVGGQTGLKGTWQGDKFRKIVQDEKIKYIIL